MDVYLYSSYKPTTLAAQAGRSLYRGLIEYGVTVDESRTVFVSDNHSDGFLEAEATALCGCCSS